MGWGRGVEGVYWGTRGSEGVLAVMGVYCMR